MVRQVGQKVGDRERAAVDAVVHISTRDDPKAIACVRMHLKSAQADVRLAAVQALARISTKGNSMVTSILMGCLKDASPDVKCAAAEMLGRTAVKGDNAALSALRGCRQGHCPSKVVEAVYEAETKIRGIAPVSIQRPSSHGIGPAST